MRKTTYFTIIALFLCFLGIGHLYIAITGGFHPSQLLKTSSGQIQNEDYAQIEEILSQPYTYLGNGHQTFAFVSQDQQYVLKLFKKDFLKRKWYYKILPPIPPLRKYHVFHDEAHQKKLDKLLSGYTTSMTKNPGSSELIAFHDHAPFSVIVIDGLGKQFDLDLNHYVFAIQRKATSTRKEFRSLLSTGQIDQAKERIRQLYSLYLDDFQHGILDDDHNIVDNTGFIDDKAIRIDVGKIKYLEVPNKPLFENSLHQAFNHRLMQWIKREFPQYTPELTSYLKHLEALNKSDKA